MARRTRYLIFVLTACLAIAVGCSGRSKHHLVGGQGSGYTGSSLTAFAGKPHAASAAAQSSAQKKNVFDTVTAPIKQVSAQVSSAFSPKKDESEPVADELNPNTRPSGLENVYLRTARAREAQGDLDAAIDQYERALKEAPTDRRALVGLARLYDRQGDFKKAVQLYQRAIDAHPKDALGYNSLGLCYARHGKLQPSIEMLQRAVELQPKVVLHRNNLATVLVDANRPDDAYKHLAAVHSEAIAHYNLGYLLSEHGEKDQATKHLKLALQADPLFAPARNLLSEITGPASNARPNSERVDRGPSENNREFPVIRLPDTENKRPSDGGTDSPSSPDYFDEGNFAPQAETRELPPVIDDSE